MRKLCECHTRFFFPGEQIPEASSDTSAFPLSYVFKITSSFVSTVRHYYPFIWKININGIIKENDVQFKLKQYQ